MLRLYSLRSTPLRSAPCSSGTMAGCDCLQVFQVVAPPFFKSSRCCWFKNMIIPPSAGSLLRTFVRKVPMLHDDVIQASLTCTTHYTSFREIGVLDRSYSSTLVTAWSKFARFGVPR